MASIIQIGDKWRAQVRRKGHKVYTKTFKTKALASAWARGVESELDAGLAPAIATVAGKRYTVAEMIADYRKLRAKSREIVEQSTEHYMLRTMSESPLGEVDVARLRPDDLVAYAQWRGDGGAGPYTINMEVSKLGTVMRMVSSVQGVSADDVVSRARPLLAHLKLIGGGGRRERRPTEDELARILNYLEQGRGKRYADVVRFAVLTCMRQGEIAGLLWADVDEAKRLILVRDRKDPRKKSGNDQWVPLLGEAWELLQAQPKGERVFPVYKQTMSKYFTEACQALSIPDLHFHDLRHHGISLLFEQGYRIEQVSLVSGHRSWQHLKRYANLRPEDLHNGPHAAKD